MKFSQNWSKYLEIMTPGEIASYYMLINFSVSQRTTFIVLANVKLMLIVLLCSFLQADVLTVKNAVSSAVDIMQAMGSSICHLLSKVSLKGPFTSTFYFYLVVVIVIYCLIHCVDLFINCQYLLWTVDIHN